MSIDGYRFRNDGELIVLQVRETQNDHYGYGQIASWRDAKTEDLLEVASLINRPRDRVCLPPGCGLESAS